MVDIFDLLFVYREYLNKHLFAGIGAGYSPIILFNKEESSLHFNRKPG